MTEAQVTEIQSLIDGWIEMYSLRTTFRRITYMTNAEVDAQLAETLRERLRTPRSKFIEMDSGDTIFEDLRLMLRELDEDPFSEKLD